MKPKISQHNLQDGICFLCGKPCEEGVYSHFDCAFAYSEKRQEEIKEKARLEREGRKVNWKER